MARTTYVFGNGLGMALDPNYFSLAAAMRHVWDLPGSKSKGLLDVEKRRIAQLVNSTNIKIPPAGEDQLLVLHRVLSSCAFLSQFENDQIQWLADEASLFPNTVRYYFGRVAHYFHNHKYQLPEEFIKNFIKRLRTTNGHLVTMNYDALFYDPLISSSVLSGYDGDLVDGFHNDGFGEENLERKFGRYFGWYLHLHGSPLFVNDGDIIRKMRRGEIDTHDKRDPLTRHIVLTHFKYKPDVITQSQLLSAYWSYFSRALSESSRVVIFGYSGCDTHVNAIIADWFKQQSMKITIVEWNGAGNTEIRRDFWMNAFRTVSFSKIKLIQMNNILEYDWSS